MADKEKNGLDYVAIFGFIGAWGFAIFCGLMGRTNKAWEGVFRVTFTVAVLGSIAWGITKWLWGKRRDP